ncbi:MAG TPA: endo-1,4-beta-xylanase, partial [Acidobacteriaceae bacterium]|nr:endo-1,4-beta-xylanase [Acidobacteriaceae bacterium]
MSEGDERSGGSESRREFLIRAATAFAAGGVSAVFPLACGQQRSKAGAIAPAPTLNDGSGARSLRAHGAARGLLVGCAVNPDHLDGDAEYARIVAEQASIVVPENAMKWAALRPSPTQYDFRQADDVVAFALSHEQKVRGHNLCWHEALPAWFAATVTKANAARYLTQHIRTVAGRYAGKLHSWDVVNEAVEVKDGRPDGLRKSPWLELMGPSYLELAFRTAREADRAALLTYNDYGIELDTPEQIDKRGQVMMLVRRLQARGVPIDAVGIQSHLSAGDAPGDGLIHFIRELRAMNLQVFITEMDVNDRKLPEAVAERDAGVAKTYRDFLTAVLAEPNVTAALTWGITDRYTWLNGLQHASRADGKPERPLPFDYDYNPTPAFFAERDAIDARPARRLPGADPYAPFRPGR